MLTRKLLIASLALLAFGVADAASAQAAAGRGGVVAPQSTPMVQALRGNGAAASLTVDDLKTGGWDCTRLDGGWYCTKDGQTPKSCTPDGKSCALTAKRPLAPTYSSSPLKAAH